MEKQENKKDFTDAKGFDGMVSVISKNQGWITVTPKRQNRKYPIEMQGVGNDNTKTSQLTPGWM